MNKKLLLLHICIAIFGVGCEKNESAEGLFDGNPITFKTCDILSKVTDNGSILSWKSGDQAVISLGDGSKVGVYNIANTQSGEMSYLSGDKHYTNGQKEQSFISWYPASLTPLGSLFAFNVENQSGVKPFLFANSSTSTDEALLMFDAIYTKVVFNLTAGGIEVTDLTGATATLIGANISGEYDYLTGQFSNQQSKTLTVTPEVATDGRTATATFYILETELMSGQMNLCIGDDLYFTPLSGKEWTKGAMYQYNVTVGSAPMLLSDFGKTYTVNSLPNENSWIIEDYGDPTTEQFEGLRSLLSSINDRTIEISFPNITSLPDEAFKEAYALQSFSAPNITAIGNSAFESCSGLTMALILPDKLISIGDSAFEGCSNIVDNSFFISYKVQTIGNRAFANCNLSGDVVIPSCVNQMGEYLFDGCDAITSFTVYWAEPPTVTANTFSSEFLIGGGYHILVPNGFLRVYEETPDWNLYYLVEAV